MKKKSGGSIWFFVGVLILILLANFLFDSGTNQEKLTYSTVLTHFREGKVNDFVIEGNNLSYTLKEDPENPVKNKNELKKEFKLYSVELFILDVGDTIAEQFENKTIESYDIMPEAGIPWWQSILPYVIILVIMGGIFYVMFNQMGGAARVRPLPSPRRAPRRMRTIRTASRLTTSPAPRKKKRNWLKS